MHNPIAWRPAAALTATLAAAALAVGCGGSDNNSDDQAAQQLVQQQQIQQARREGARDARQEERIRQLEAKVKDAKQHKTVTQVVQAPASSSSAGDSSNNVPVEQPAGSAGWIAQLGSFSTVSAAQAQASRLSADGLHVNVLDSDNFVELRGGYWVVYAGFFQTRASADAAVSSAKGAGAVDAFARYVTPRST